MRIADRDAAIEPRIYGEGEVVAGGAVYRLCAADRRDGEESRNEKYESGSARAKRTSSVHDSPLVIIPNPLAESFNYATPLPCSESQKRTR
jgi:hypothetical protein